MPLIALDHVTKLYGARTVLDDATLEIQRGEKVGLIGANGTGKTSILRLLTGELAADGGTVVRERGCRIGYLPQVPDLGEGLDVRGEAARAFADLARLEAELRALEHTMADAPDPAVRDAAIARHGEVQARFEAAGGWDRERRVEAALMGLGFAEADLAKPVKALSGGEKNRLALAKVLLAEPDLLCLDEPTNFLDLEATAWLEEFLREAPEAVLVVSHDRYLLDRVAERVVELERTHTQSYRGNYSAYLVQKAERVLTLQRESAQQAAFVERTEEFIRRHIAGQRSAEARGRRTKLARLARIDAPTEASIVSIRFPSAERGPQVVCDVRDVAKAYAGRTLFSGCTFKVERGERLGIVGANGSGKTTLLRILRGEVAPDRGTAAFGPGVTVGFYEQEHRDLLLDGTVLDNVRAVRPRDSDERLRTILGMLLFTGDDSEKRLRVLSGGERSRVALARLLLSGANCLVLDEPTNHLDIPSRDSVEAALDAYDGTILVVSHDRYLLDALVDRLLILEPTGPRLFAGNWSDWAARRATKAVVRPPSSVSRPPARPQRAKRVDVPVSAAAPPRPRKRPLATVEAELVACEEALAAVNAALADEANWRDGEKMRSLQTDLAARQAERAALEAEWSAHAG